MQTHIAAPHTPAAAPAAPPTFVAIDFETADYGHDSACALALVRLEAVLPGSGITAILKVARFARESFRKERLLRLSTA